MGYGSSRQADSHRESSERIYVRVACYSHIHFMDWERFRTAWLWNAVKDYRVHSSLLSPMALKGRPVSHANRPSRKRRRVWTLGAREMKRPREKIAGPWVAGGAHVRHAHGHEKAPAVVMTVGADARGLLDDLHVGADAFRGDVDVAGP